MSTVIEPNIVFWVPYQIAECPAEFLEFFEKKSETGFVIFAKFCYRNMCIMPNIDFWVPYQIAECPAEFPGFLENEI
jgi:hypothetical protein